VGSPSESPRRAELPRDSELPRGVIRVRLYSVASAGAKVVLGGCLIGATVILVPILGLFVGIYADSAHAGAGWIVGAVVGAGFAVLFLGRLLWLLRSAAWLDDTTLVVRRTVTTRRCDLATAARLDLDMMIQVAVTPVVGGMAMASTAYVPKLIAHDAVTARRVVLELVHPATGKLLAAPKLHALSDAILARRDHGPDGSSARQVAAALRSLSTDHVRPVR
jgi:hypothetical protein